MGDALGFGMGAVMGTQIGLRVWKNVRTFVLNLRVVVSEDTLRLNQGYINHK